MKAVEFYEAVPDRSRLEVSFGPEKGPYTGTVLLITSGDIDDETWKDAELRPGPRTHPLRSGRAYMLEMRQAFVKDGKGTIEARVIKEDGSPYSTPKTWTIQGKKSKKKPELRVLIIRMAQ